MESSKSSSTQDRPSVNFTRHYNVAPEKVWRAWTDPKALAQWFGPDSEGVVSLADMDVRVGGRYHIRFGVPGGEEHDVSGVYQEVTPGRKLVFSWAWKSTPERVSLVTVTLQPSGSGTELTFVHEKFYDQAARDGHNQGWTGAFAKLDRFLA
ncbi:MAG: SRPBCC family protein [Polaromonas sp.]